MKSARIVFLGVLVFIFSFSSLSFCGVPQMINYQGKITTPGGALIDTTIAMEFVIYDDSTTGNVLWADTLSSVVVEKGVFSVLLGSGNPIPDSVFDGSVRYLGVKVGSDPEMTPRKAIVSVGYAYKAEYADTAQYAYVAVSDGDWEPDTSGINIYRLTGNVGIGTPAPQERLHIVGGYQSTRIKLENSASGGKTFMLRTGVDPNGGFGISDQTALTEPFFIESGAATNLMYLKGNNVGIGTTSPNEQLEITGNLRLPVSTSTAGIIKVGADRFMHSHGDGNTFVGKNAGNPAMTGTWNSGYGYEALYSNTTGTWNSAYGYQALYSNTTGGYNTAYGYQALYSNTTGGSNTANGYLALYSNNIGAWNTAYGRSALLSNTEGCGNTANGQASLYHNTTGNYNTADGYFALYFNTTGSYNTALGYKADVSVDSLTNATAVGYDAKVNASNKVRIGNGSVTVIEGQVDWSFPSDARLKTNVQKSPLGLDFILNLKPITYNSLAKGQEGITYTGLVAQDVEKVLDELGIEFSGLVKPANRDDSYSLRYATFVMPLIRALQEQQEQIKALQQRVEELEKK